VWGVGDVGQLVGNAPLVDGRVISVRLRRDFTITNADRLLAAARRMYLELHPGASAEDAAAMVSCSADALFVILERAGLLGDVVDGRLAEHESEGLAVGGGGGGKPRSRSTSRTRY
jgi:hypothetical protein